jgi:hypothetical protein
MKAPSRQTRIKNSAIGFFMCEYRAACVFDPVYNWDRGSHN